jgi:hypothetical protein
MRMPEKDEIARALAMAHKGPWEDNGVNYVPAELKFTLAGKLYKNPGPALLKAAVRPRGFAPVSDGPRWPQRPGLPRLAGGPTTRRAPPAFERQPRHAPVGAVLGLGSRLIYAPLTAGGRSSKQAAGNQPFGRRRSSRESGARPRKPVECWSADEA